MRGQLSLGALITELGGRAKPKRKARPRDLSREAADSMAGHTERLRTKVLHAIQVEGASGATCDELEASLDMRHQTCSARVHELMRVGRIVDSGNRRITRSGRKATVWIAP